MLARYASLVVYKDKKQKLLNRELYFKEKITLHSQNLFEIKDIDGFVRSITQCMQDIFNSSKVNIVIFNHDNLTVFTQEK